MEEETKNPDSSNDMAPPPKKKKENSTKPVQKQLATKPVQKQSAVAEASISKIETATKEKTLTQGTATKKNKHKKLVGAGTVTKSPVQTTAHVAKAKATSDSSFTCSNDDDVSDGSLEATFEPTPKNSKASSSGRIQSGSERKASASQPVYGNETTKDYYLLKPVAFDVDTAVGQGITQSLKVPLVKDHLDRNYLIGDVVRKSGAVKGTRKKPGHVLYDVAWRYSCYGETSISNISLNEGIIAYHTLGLQSQDNTRSPGDIFVCMDPFQDSALKDMLQDSVEESYVDLPALSSESDSDESTKDGCCEDMLFSQSHFEFVDSFRKDNEHQPEYGGESSDDEEVDNVNASSGLGLEWIPTTSGPTASITVDPSKSMNMPAEILPNFQEHFSNPTTSFFPFLPETIWQKITFETNTYAHEKSGGGKKTLGGILGRKTYLYKK